MVQMEAPSSSKIMKLVFLRKTDAEPKTGDQKLQSHRDDISDVDAARALYFSSSRREREPEIWKTLHLGGVDGISCQHLQIMITKLLQKQWEWQEERDSHIEAWQCGALNHVFGKHGHQDGFR